MICCSYDNLRREAYSHDPLKPGYTIIHHREFFQSNPRVRWAVWGIEAAVIVIGLFVGQALGLVIGVATAVVTELSVPSAVIKVIRIEREDRVP